jgi:1,4-alpha-glucan branching enzyme
MGKKAAGKSEVTAEKKVKKAAAKPAAKPAAKSAVKSDIVKVTFKLFAPHADKVALVGSFNGWDAKKSPMKKDAKGTWSKSLELAPGSYEYKFLVDHEWWSDPACDHFIHNEFGTHNSLIHIG